MLAFRSRWDKMTDALRESGFTLDYTIEDVIC